MAFVTSPRCAICQSPLEPDGPRTACSSCGAEYHADCWEENRGCAVYGCPQVPPAEARAAADIPASYWGREHKPCPSCGREILAAAVRCRHCGATFASARPEDVAEYEQRAARGARRPAIRRTVVWIFILSVVPCTAPFGALWGLAWRAGHSDDLRGLPALHSALSRIGLFVAIGQTAGMGIFAALYSLMHHS